MIKLSVLCKYTCPVVSSKGDFYDTSVRFRRTSAFLRHFEWRHMRNDYRTSRGFRSSLSIEAVSTDKLVFIWSNIVRSNII